MAGPPISLAVHALGRVTARVVTAMELDEGELPAALVAITR